MIRPRRQSLSTRRLPLFLLFALGLAAAAARADSAADLQGAVALTTAEIRQAFSNVRDQARVQDAAGTRAVNHWYADGSFVNRWQNAQGAGEVHGRWRAHDGKRCIVITRGLPARAWVERCAPVYRRGEQYLSLEPGGAIHGIHTLTLLPAAEIPLSAERAAAQLLQRFGGELDGLLFEFADERRREWTYLPWGHTGTRLKDMTETQRATALALTDTALSAAGRETMAGVMRLEAELHRTTWFKPFRDPGRYYLALFGEPEGDAPWSWRIGGHHLSVNLTSVDGQRSGTPLFFGANPARVPEGPVAGLRILAQEEDDARALYLSLDAGQRQRALLDEDAPWDIVTARDAEASIACCEGLPGSAMTGSQQQALTALVHLMTTKLQPQVAASLERSVMEDGMAQLYFAWAGSELPGEGHYYRIRGSRLLIEYDNTQGDANHIHLVLRDLQRDFGADLLREHYRQDSH